MYVTVFEAMLLVVLVIFLFLRNWRAVLIPIVTIPVSLIGAFAIMYMLGFSINILSLLAMVLAIGLVVDDAIVDAREHLPAYRRRHAAACRRRLKAARKSASPSLP